MADLGESMGLATPISPTIARRGRRWLLWLGILAILAGLVAWQIMAISHESRTSMQAIGSHGDMRERLKGLQSACLAYSKQHGGRLPDSYHWTDSLRPYVTSSITLINPLMESDENDARIATFAFNRDLSGKRLRDCAKIAPLIFGWPGTESNLVRPASEIPKNLEDWSNAYVTVDGKLVPPKDDEY